MTGLRHHMRSLYYSGWVALFALVIVVCMSSIGSAAAEDITIAAASDLNFAFKELVTEYERTTGNHVKLTLGLLGQFLRANSKWRAVRSVFFRRHRLSQEIGRSRSRGAGIALSLCRWADCLVGR